MPLPELMVGAAGERFDQDGNLIDEAVRDSLGGAPSRHCEPGRVRIDIRSSGGVMPPRTPTDRQAQPSWLRTGHVR